MKAIAVSVAAMLTLVASPASGFYETEAVDLRATVLISETVFVLPDLLGGAGTQTNSSLRVLGTYSFNDTLSFEAHVLGVAAGGSIFGLLRSGDADRLTWNLHESGLAVSDLVVDRLLVQLDFSKVHVKVGRQPINLTTSFFFTPNDFFVPFAAQAFFRLYKPGVDAARVDVQLGEVSELTVLGVLGQPDAFDDASAIARMSFVISDFELAVLGGKRPDAYVAGASFQGEVFEWLGVRGEGHVRVPTATGRDATVEATVNFEHLFENTLSLRLETFYHGGGATDPARYAPFGATGQYAGRVYTAAGAGYQLTPLLNAQALAIFNWVDRSALLALYAVYSLDDEMELGVSVNAPLGQRPVVGPPPRVRSEFGSFPWVIDAQFRAYF